VLMVVAGVLIWANAHQHVEAVDSGYLKISLGWPFTYRVFAQDSKGNYLQELLWPNFAGHGDALIALAILTAVAVGYEYLIRRREMAMKQVG